MEKEVVIIKGMPHKIEEINLGKLNKDDFNIAINSPQYYTLDKDEIIVNINEYKMLLANSKNLSNLEGMGVDNWDGYYECKFINSEDINFKIKNKRIA